MRSSICLLLTAAAIAFLVAGSPPAGASAARECLDLARSAALEIQLAGDQSAALRDISLALVRIDPLAVPPIVLGMRRPSDSARAIVAVAVAAAAGNPDGAAQDVVTAGRLLLRISNADQRLTEQRLLLEEASPLGAPAVEAAPELELSEARLLLLLSLARRDPPAAAPLLQQWQLSRDRADQARAALSVALAGTDPDQALELASAISSTQQRDAAIWLIAGKRPAEEVTGLALRLVDPLVRSACLSQAAVSLAGKDPDSALLIAEMVQVSPNSTRAEAALAMAPSDETRALALARSLPPRPRAWALSRLAVELALANPALSEEILREAGSDPQALRLAVLRMATFDPDRALRLARSLPEGEARDAALASLARAWASTAPDRVHELLWEIASPAWKGTAVAPLALALAPTDADAATSLLGLVSDAETAGRIRARVAAAAAAREPEIASRLLTSLPPSDFRNDACLDAAAAALGAGSPPEKALALGAIGLDADLSLRWALPSLASSQTRSPVNLAGGIKDPYRRALALVGVATELQGGPARPRPAPERAAQIRPIVEWESR